MESLLIKGGTVLVNGPTAADVLIEDGVIKGIAKEGKLKGDRQINAGGMLVLPGAIDEHVHCREPGLTYKDNFARCTMAAAAGGVTAVFDMPNTVPPTDSAERLREKRKLLSEKAYVDFGLYGVLHDLNLDQFEPMLSEGAIGFKIYLAPTTGNLPPPGDAAVYRALELSAKHDVTVVFHAENGNMITRFSSEVLSRRSDPRAHMEARPPVAEEEAVRRVLLLSLRTGGRAMIAHVSTADALQAIREFRARGARVIAETCPHYMLLSEKDYDVYGSLIKVNPPIRTEADRAAIVEGVLDGTITNVGSDHAPHTLEEKMGNVRQAPSGIIGVQTMLPLLLDMGLKGQIPLDLVPRLVSENPARTFGLYPLKGSLSVGAYGDLVLVDPKSSWRVRAEDLYDLYPTSPFIGRELAGRVKYTVLRGNVVYEDGVGHSGPFGSYLPRRAP